ncbi:hypothetical protein [Phytohabitans kaempferiae]|uniref:Uncharacterized protein n=1 Tax=Phytohabitans kaempferiae TaxID=1620943 RepID=A0ABV6M9H5_9ACTN
MSYPALVGALDSDDTFHARQLHWAAPHRTVTDLRTIWTTTFHRDLTATRQALLNHDWALLCPSCHHGRLLGTAFLVPGVGHALRDTGPAIHGNLHWPTADVAKPEWMYLLHEPSEQVLVYEATVHRRWLPHSSHRLDPDQPPPVLGCGGHRRDGHRWQPAQVTLLGPPTPTLASYHAEVCTAPHPRGFAIARFTDDVADQIATHSQNAAPPWGPPLPRLRRDGTEFDLVWTNATVRVARDHDGRLLIGAHLLPWQNASHDGSHPA